MGKIVNLASRRPVRLTDPMRAWLAERDGKMLLKDFVVQFSWRFELRTQDIGRLLLQWVQERKAGA